MEEKKKMKFEPDGARWLTRLGLFNTQPFKRDEHSGCTHSTVTRNIPCLMDQCESSVIIFVKNESNKACYQSGEKCFFSFSDMYGRFLDHYN